MNKIVKISDFKDWKDRAAGWCRWRILIPKCQGCGKENTSYTISGTKADTERFASDPAYNYCNRCS